MGRNRSDWKGGGCDWIPKWSLWLNGELRAILIGANRHRLSSKSREMSKSQCKCIHLHTHTQAMNATNQPWIGWTVIIERRDDRECLLNRKSSNKLFWWCFSATFFLPTLNSSGSGLYRGNGMMWRIGQGPFWLAIAYLCDLGEPWNSLGGIKHRLVTFCARAAHITLGRQNWVTSLCPQILCVATGVHSFDTGNRGAQLWHWQQGCTALTLLVAANLLDTGSLSGKFP